MQKSKDEWFSYLDSVSLKLKIDLLLMLLAILIYMGWYILNIGAYFSFTYLHISVGHFGYMGLLFTPAFFVIENNFLQKIWIFFTSLTLLDLQNMMYITNDLSLNMDNIFFNSVNIIILMLLFLLVTLFGTSKSISSKGFVTKWKDLMIVMISSFIIILIYHAINLLIREIPNEDRSCYIGGLECHHINYGILLLVIVPFIFKFVSRLDLVAFKVLGYIFIGLIYGTVFDESFYYMLQDVSDNNYFDILVTLISIMIMLISFFIWFYYLIKVKMNET